MTRSEIDATEETPARATDILIVGSGFSGLAMAIQLKQAGFDSFLMIEKAAAIGGTWRDNIYPGAACDVPSHLYSLSFEPKTDWSRTYPRQPELRAYLEDIVDKHELRSRIAFHTTMRDAIWDEAAQLWRVVCENGTIIDARVLVSGTGGLHLPLIPKIAGLETFAGACFHSATWDATYDLQGKCVAVIGTGASAIQFVPKIAPKVEVLTLFQRTPPWITAKVDPEIGPLKQWALKYVPFYRRLLRTKLFWLQEVAVLGFLGAFSMMRLGQKVAKTKIAREIADPALREKVTPSYLLGCKRVLISNDYYPALNRPNVDLVTAPIREIVPSGIVTGDGVLHKADAIIFGTGFHVTDSFEHLHIVGQGGLELKTAWSGGLDAYWGICVAGFPNYFLLLGPNTALGHNSVVIMIEAQVQFVVSALKQMKAREIGAIVVKPEAMRAFRNDVDRRMEKTVWQSGGCRSWYQDANGRITTLWPGSVVRYVRQTRHAKLEDFDLMPTSQLPRFVSADEA